MVRWSLFEAPEYATTCNCTLCRRWGALWAYGFKDEDFRVSGDTQTYLREPRTIEFHFCHDCGCVAYWCTTGPGEDGRFYGAVNLRLAEPAPIGSVQVRYFDGLEKFEALPHSGKCVSDILWA